MTEKPSQASGMSTTSDPQVERTDRARTALLEGKFQIIRAAPGVWTVKNGDKEPYTVSFQSGAWTCTCMDFQQRGPEVRCKHIEGVRLSEDVQLQTSQTKSEEHHMEEIQNQTSANELGNPDPIIWELRQPLDMTRVKRRQAPGMGSVPYLEGFDVIDRANTIFGFRWSFDLLGQPIVTRWEKKVMVWNQQERRKIPILDTSGKPQTEEVGIVHITGKVTVFLGNRAFTHADLGRCVFTGDTPEALDMALAGAVTDCLKRCFRQCGEQFGNSLYDKEIAQSAGLDNGSEDSHTSQGSTQVSTQRAASQAAKTVVRKYSDGTSVNGNVTEQEAYDQYKAKTGKAPASKEDLRSWIASQRTPATVAG